MIIHYFLKAYDQTLVDDFLEEIRCSILYAAETVDRFEEIIILFDHDTNLITTLKYFVKLWGLVTHQLPVTLLMVNSQHWAGFSFEQSFIQYLRKNFKDVGIIPLASTDVNQQIQVVISNLRRPVTIMSKKAVKSFKDDQVFSNLILNEKSFFYYNDSN